MACRMCGGPASPVSLDCEFKAAASAPVQISSEALPGETASRLFELFGCAQLAEMVELFGGYDLSVADLVVPQTQSAALVAHSQHDPESRRPIRSKQPPAASRASPKRVRGETPTRGTRCASERTPVKEESAAKSRRAVEAVTSSDVTSSEVDAVARRFASSNSGIVCDHGRKRKQCGICRPCPCTAGELVGNRRLKSRCRDCNPCACTAGKLVGNRRRKGHCSDCNPCECTQGKPAGERRRWFNCSDCNPCECTRGKPAGERIRKNCCHRCHS
jgi:hypothetical protein